MEDLRGMYLVAAQNRQGSTPSLYWLSPQGLYLSALVDDPTGGLIATPDPGSEETTPPDKTPKPGKRSPKP